MTFNTTSNQGHSRYGNLDVLLRGKFSPGGHEIVGGRLQFDQLSGLSSSAPTVSLSRRKGSRLYLVLKLIRI